MKKFKTSKRTAGQRVRAAHGSALYWCKPGLKIAGVMRCCVETLDKTEVREVEGKVLKCEWCSHSLVFRDGAWQWNREPNK